MDIKLNNSIYEQLLYTLILQIKDVEVSPTEAKQRARHTGESFGYRAFVLYASQNILSPRLQTSALVTLISTAFWRFLFDHECEAVEIKSSYAFSFKDPSFHLLKSILKDPDTALEFQRFGDVFTAFVEGLLQGAFKVGGCECIVKATYDQEVLLLKVSLQV